MSTAYDEIVAALKIIGVLAETETPSAAMLADSLDALNVMLDSWSTEQLSIFSTQDQLITWPANQATITLGPSGSIVGTRPIKLDDATYFLFNGISYPIQIINKEQYTSIPNKSITTQIPIVLYPNMAMPNCELTFYPIPSQNLQVHIVSIKALSNIPDASASLVFPPGYLRAFRFNLACEIANQFGIEPSQQTQRIAMKSKSNIKRINNPMDVMTIPTSLLKPIGSFNIYSGGFQ